MIWADPWATMHSSCLEEAGSATFPPPVAAATTFGGVVTVLSTVTTFIEPHPAISSDTDRMARSLSLTARVTLPDPLPSSGFRLI